jgi:poly(A) polymerase
VEIATYRAESYDLDSRKPEVAFGEELDEDLRRRDFTVNSMAVELPAGGLLDPHGGMADLVAGLLRTPGAPEESFGDDPLRMLRAARFVSQLGLRIDAGTRSAMVAMAGRIDIVSPERVRDELVKLMMGADPVAGLRVLVDTGGRANPARTAGIVARDRRAPPSQGCLRAHSRVLEQSIVLKQPTNR